MTNLTIRTDRVLMPTAPDFYGLFFEDINRAGDGGLYPEMLRNRSFEDSIVPDGCTVVTTPDGSTDIRNENGWQCPFNNGEGKAAWAQYEAPTAIPAWYSANAAMALDDTLRLNDKRRVSLRVDFAAGGRIWNTGYGGVPCRKDEGCCFYGFFRADQPITLTASLESRAGQIYARREIAVPAGDFIRLDAALIPDADDSDAIFVLAAPDGGKMHVGFASLMPADTFKQHGLRRDLMALLDGAHAKFLRFPGGCVVEGFSRETMMRFSNTVGPVWERPSHNLMWHYRTTNGLGFHEYLQLCEDLGIEAMYVINVGISCQVRGPVYEEGDALQGWLQEAFDAIEYATGAPNTRWGSLRARMGHPEPFALKYIEIGNENMGPEYTARYALFYKELKRRHPEIIYISNTHTEEEGLPTEVVDEHFYDTSAYFAESCDRFRAYDPQGPKIFIGEYQVFQGEDTATLQAALCESMFLMGAEKCQDIVTLTAYAPMLQHVKYAAWYPNLIAYDNTRSFGIPTYHALSLLGANRGTQLIDSRADSQVIRFVPTSGIPGMGSELPGVQFRNPRCNGQSVQPDRFLQNMAVPTEDGWVTAIDPSVPPLPPFPGKPDTSKNCFLTFDASSDMPQTFEVEVLCPAGNAVIITALNRTAQAYIFSEEHGGEEVWNHRTIRNARWRIGDGQSSAVDPCIWGDRELAAPVPCSLSPDAWHTLRTESTADGFDAYVDGELIQHVRMTAVPAIDNVVTMDNSTVYVKLLNMTARPEPVTINLDCDVAPDYACDLLTANDPMARNDLDAPERVSPVHLQLTGAGRSFVHQTPAWSLSVLRLSKR